MNCENCFCIYEFKGKCTVSEISIDSLGMCTECIYHDIDDESLQEFKAKTLKEFNE